MSGNLYDGFADNGTFDDSLWMDLDLDDIAEQDADMDALEGDDETGSDISDMHPEVDSTR